MTLYRRELVRRPSCLTLAFLILSEREESVRSKDAKDAVSSPWIDVLLAGPWEALRRGQIPSMAKMTPSSRAIAL